MDRRTGRLVAIPAIALAITLALTACGSDTLDTPTWNEPADPGQPVVPGFLLVDRRAADADQALAVLNEIGSEIPLERSGLLNPDLEQQFNGAPVFEAVSAEVAFFDLGGAELDDALRQVEAAGILPETVAPIHRVTGSGHWSAYPGTKPVSVEAQAWNDGSADVVINGADRTIGIVDTGIASDSPNATAVGPSWHATDSHHTICDGALHGEAAASAIRQVNPKATVYSANAFPIPQDCWVTDEIDVLIATALLQIRAATDGFEYDAINFSVGTPAYHFEEPGTRFPPIILRLIVRDVPAVAAGGNSPEEGQIYPAAYSTAVHAADPAGDAVVWDKSGSPVSPTTTVTNVAPGCALIVQGLSDGSDGLDDTRVVVWAGSSFASPIYAALGDAVMSSIDPGDMYETILPPRMNNHGSDLYPSAPTDC